MLDHSDPLDKLLIEGIDGLTNGSDVIPAVGSVFWKATSWQERLGLRWGAQHSDATVPEASTQPKPHRRMGRNASVVHLGNANH